MGRQRNNLVKRAAGVFVPNFKSKSSPSHKNYQQKRKKPNPIGRPLYRHHRKRTQLKCKLARELGLPKDAKFVFRRRISDPLNVNPPKPLIITHGTVVVIDKADLSLVMVVRCIPFESMKDELRKQFNHTVSTVFHHARARNRCKIHCSFKDEHGKAQICGWMGCCGWRGGCDKDKSFGAYAVSVFTATTRDRLLTDKQRMEQFHIIRNFLAERFSTLSLSVFKTNLALGTAANVPGFDELTWQDTPNGLVFASNLAISCDGFCNHPHSDKDHTRYAFGIFGLINRATGEPCDQREALKLGKVVGTSFNVKEFGIIVALDQIDGLSEILWDSTIPHFTSASKSYDANGVEVEPKDCKVTQFGSSCQISESLVQRIQILQNEKAGMTQQQWEEYKEERVKTYENENSLKMKKEESNRRLRAERAREYRRRKVEELIAGEEKWRN